MPNISPKLLKASKSKHFFNLDFVVSYWQLFIETSLQISQFSVVPDAIFTPTQVFHGSTNGAHHFQFPLGASLPTELNQVLLRWLNDVLGHG